VEELLLSPALKLNPGLQVDATERPGPPVVEPRAGYVQLPQRFEGCGAMFDQRPPLLSADPGDKGEVVDVAPFPGAGIVPGADITVRYRVNRQRHFRGSGRNPLKEALANRPEIGGVVIDPKLGAEGLRPTQRQMHVFGGNPLNGLQQVGVEEDLEQRAAFGLPSQLGVDNLVRPVPKVTRAGNLSQEIGIAQPIPVKQHPLIDDVGAGPHRIYRGLGEAVEALRPVTLRLEAGEVRDPESAPFLQTRKVVLLVLHATPLEHVDAGIVKLGGFGPPRADRRLRSVRWGHARKLLRSVAEKMSLFWGDCMSVI
jgi:hypothetical protein